MLLEGMEHIFYLFLNLLEPWACKESALNKTK